MRFKSSLALAVSGVVFASLVGCASTAAKPDDASKPVADQPASSASAPNPPTAGTAPAPAASARPAVMVSWWSKPAPTIPGKQTFIAQADGTDAATARRAALEAGTTKLQSLGADVSRIEVLEATVTRVRFNGPFRAFVLVAAPKAE